MHRPKAALFDMDGLLIDSEPLWESAIHAFCVRRGAAYSREDAAACMGRGIPHSARYLAERHGWALDVEAHVAEIIDAFVLEVPRAPPRKGAEQLLTSLQGAAPVGLGSSSPRRVIEAALAGRGWLDLFGAVVTGSDVEHLKPAPDIYLEAARRLGQRPGDCVVFEDSQAGCASGRAAGMIVVAVPGDGVDPAPFASLADVVASDLVEGALAVGLGQKR